MFYISGLHFRMPKAGLTVIHHALVLRQVDISRPSPSRHAFQGVFRDKPPISYKPGWNLLFFIILKRLKDIQG